ncbi:TetR/AcrR family transcriptional regulator [Virgibacillus dokdonensis]|uniref:Biofilm operon icaADBC HTH-type negative transcriptional regulator IcaR n=1 Tax=Virgibacillus dokdonensis TaxID=302167 RepID=A0A2K9IYI3_9BACI|nr:TetR/AcrR family transcriptional regulator [Virgibacillus dokdonensis]AUJ24524.1 Biofilm operon icaADBC HTH-type negative transcriptional regulator IcaR [Virgibacillus dokdonensis]
MSKGEQTKKKILENGLILFSTKGYEQTSLKDIASEVSIKAPAIYAHFANKKVLFESIFEKVITDYIEHLTDRISTIQKSSTKEQLYELLVGTNIFFYENKHIGLFMKKYSLSPPESINPITQKKMQTLTNNIEVILCSFLEETPDRQFIETNKIIDTFFSLLDGSFFYLENFSKQDFYIRMNNIWEVFWKGIQK